MATDHQPNNANPHVFERCGERRPMPSDEDEGIRDPIDDWEVFDLIRWIADPEHPELSLEELGVVELSGVEVKDAAGESSTVEVRFTPTVPHCSMATLIGLSVMARLQRTLPDRFKVDVSVAPGTHDAEDDVNKQLADKERVAAALENSHILEVVDRCLADKHRW